MTSSLLKIFLSCWAVTSFTAAAVSTDPKDVQIMNKIDNFVKKAMPCHHSQALSLSVVKDGRVIMSKGYGPTRPKNNGQKTTELTKFSIASLSKAFLGLLVAKLIKDSNNLEWDTPIANFIPGFRQTDDYRSSKATLRDLLSHRMAVESPFLPALFGIDPSINRTEFASKMAPKLKETTSFRNRYGYSNYMFVLATYLLEKLSPGGGSFEDILMSTILYPLGMMASGFIHQVRDFADFAYPTTKNYDTGTFVELDPTVFQTVHYAGGAGSMYSTADDMAKWMNLMLSQTTVSGIDQEMIQSVFVPSMKYYDATYLSKPAFPVLHKVTHTGQGWNMGVYRDHELITHTGTLITHKSSIWLFPEKNVGIFVVINGPLDHYHSQYLREGIFYYASDLLLGHQPWFKKSQMCSPVVPWKKKPYIRGKPKAVTAITLNNLDRFAGNFTNEAFGTARLVLSNNHAQLHFKYGRFGDVKLTPVSANKFAGEYMGPLSFMNPVTWAQFSIEFKITNTNCVESFSCSPSFGPFINDERC